MSKKIGRPKIEIDWIQFEKLCGLHCTLCEIAAWFHCSDDTIENAVENHYGQRFSEIYRQKQGLGKISLRRKMFEKAMEGNPALLIWLSKQHLSMSDKLEQKVEEKVEVTNVVYKTEYANNPNTPKDN